MYKTIRGLKSKVKRRLQKEDEQTTVVKKRPSKKNNKEVKDAILEYIEEKGFYDIKCRTLRDHLLTKVAAAQVPSISTLGIMLKETFHLHK